MRSSAVLADGIQAMSVALPCCGGSATPFDQHAGFEEGCEDLPVEQLVAKLAVEAPAVVRAALHEVVAADWPLCLGRSRTQLPSLSQSRPRFGYFLGTFSPSCFQIRSTRLWFTGQPSRWSSAVIRR